MSNTRPAVVVGVKSLATLTFMVGLTFLTMPSQLYPGDNHGIRLAATNLYLHHSFGIDYALRDKLFPYLTNKGQVFLENDAQQKFYSRWGELNTLLFVIPEFFRQPSDLGITPDLVIYANGLNLFFIGLATLYLMALCAQYGASRGGTFLFLACVYYGTFEMTYLRAQTYEVIHLAFFCGYIYHFIGYLRSSRLRSLALAQIYLLLLVLSKTTFFTIFASSIVFLAWEHIFEVSSDGRRSWRKAIAIQVGFMILGLALHLGWLYHKTGVFQLTSEGGYIPGTPDVFALKNVWARIKEYSASPNGSLFLLFPPLAVALFYWPKFYRVHRLEARLLLSAMAVTLLLLLPFNSRGEACYGPRYFVFILPVMALPLLGLERQRRWDRAAIGFLTVTSLYSFRLHHNMNSRPAFTAIQLRSWAIQDGEKGQAARDQLENENYALTILRMNEYILGLRAHDPPLDRYVVGRTDPEVHKRDMLELDQRFPCNFYFSILCPSNGWFRP